MGSDSFKGPMNTSAREWDAETYEEISDPQLMWGMEALERLEVKGDETVVDAGCGTGRVTEALLERLPDGHVIAVDGSEDMIGKARERLGDRVDYVHGDLLELSLPEPVDVVFSTATLHWILDHDALFRRLRSVLRPGGRIVAQCGGKGNAAAHARAIGTVASRHEFGQHFSQMPGLWNFASPEETESILAAAGFTEVRCWLEPKPLRPDRPLEFISAMTLGPILAQLPEEKRRPFAEAVLEASRQPLVIDYLRLNIEAVAR
jgi:trans-aconitate 2-methyltransferase